MYWVNVEWTLYIPRNVNDRRLTLEVNQFVAVINSNCVWAVCRLLVLQSQAINAAVENISSLYYRYHNTTVQYRSAAASCLNDRTFAMPKHCIKIYSGMCAAGHVNHNDMLQLSCCIRIASWLLNMYCHTVIFVPPYPCLIYKAVAVPSGMLLCIR